MSDRLEFDPVDRITIAAIGEPGRRTFMLQAVHKGSVTTLVIEKEQALAIAKASQQLLTRVGYAEPAIPPESPQLAFDERQEPAWRVGSIEMGYIEERDVVFLKCDELVAEDDEPGTSVLFVVSRAQLGALGMRALTVAAAGRPRCPLCKLPLNPEGHICPAMNGHGRAELEAGELELLGLLPAASNYTFLARLHLAGTARPAEPPLVVYKPQRGEAPLWDFPTGTLCQRELAAYLVSEAAGWAFVPPTVLRDGPHGLGMVQAFVDHDFTVTAFDLVGTAPRALRRIVLFDAVVNNADRKAGHVFADADGAVWAVDHGICFHHQPKLRTVLWDFVGLPLTPGERATLEVLGRALDADLGAVLEPLLRPVELDALRGRAARMAAVEYFPEPGPGRPYPWPPV